MTSSLEVFLERHDPPLLITRLRTELFPRYLSRAPGNWGATWQWGLPVSTNDRLDDSFAVLDGYCEVDAFARVLFA